MLKQIHGDPEHQAFEHRRAATSELENSRPKAKKWESYACTSFDKHGPVEARKIFLNLIETYLQCKHAVHRSRAITWLQSCCTWLSHSTDTVSFRQDTGNLHEFNWIELKDKYQIFATSKGGSEPTSVSLTLACNHPMLKLLVDEDWRRNIFISETRFNVLQLRDTLRNTSISSVVNFAVSYNRFVMLVYVAYV